MVLAQQTKDLMDRLGGVNAVLITPFRESTGPLDPDRTAQLARRCDRAGVHAITALGNTAELYQLTDQEKLDMLRAVADGAEQAALIAGVAGATPDALRLAETAAELGYQAVMPHEPLDPLAGDRGISRFLGDLVDRSPLPCVLYLRTTRLSEPSIAELVGHPNVAAVKYARPELRLLAGLLADDKTRSACVWACGAAESMVPAMRGYGVVGFTSGLANVRPDLALGVWQASRSGDAAVLAERVRMVLAFELARARDGGRHNVAVVKWALRRSGFDVGDVRPPCEPLDDTTIAVLEESLLSWPPATTTAMID